MTPAAGTMPGTAGVWRRLWVQLTPRRRRQLLLATGLMLVSGALEMLSLAAVVPLLVGLMQWGQGGRPWVLWLFCLAVSGAALVHDHEVFGPVSTLVAYRDLPHALALARRGQGSLVASVYGSDAAALAGAALDLAASHGRVHVVSPEVAATHTGHGNVMPQSLHGGPGRAGGGEELGGLKALNFYHRRAALQAGSAVLGALG